MRFAMVTTFYPPYNFGGDGIYVERLSNSLVARGHSVEVIHDTDGFRALSGTDPEPTSESEVGGVKIHRLRGKSATLSALAAQQVGKPIVHGERIAQLLKDRFDVIHFHNISLVGGPGVWEMGNAIKLHTAHEHWLVCPTHVLWRHNREVCDKRECLRCSYAYRRPPQLWRSTGHIARSGRSVDAFLTFSSSTVENHRRFGFPFPMQVVPSFLPEQPPLPKETHQTWPRPFFLCVGRLENIKGFDQVIRAMRRSDFDLLIAGSGAEESRLKAEADGAENIVFLGQKSPEELRVLYRDALALIAPSRCYEVFPLVVLEAFREGTPIIARRLGPFPEIVAQSGAGLLFDDEEGLGSAAEQLAQTTELRDKLGKSALSAFEALWSETAAMNAYFGVIDRLKAK